MGKKKPEKRGDTMDFTIDWDNLPSMEEERNTCPLKAVSLWKMDKGGLRRLTTTDNFLDMDNYIRDFAATGHNRMKVCVLAAHWKVEENFRGYGVMAVPLRIDRKLEKAENICENTLLHDAMRQCSFIHMEDSNASKDIRHNKAMAASLYNLEGLRETFVREVNNQRKRLRRRNRPTGRGHIGKGSDGHVQHIGRRQVLRPVLRYGKPGLGKLHAGDDILL